MARTLLAVVAITLSLAFAQPANAIVPPLTQPTWVQLAPEQKQTLAPLSEEWDRLEPWRRKKWLGIALRYNTMGPEEQARVQRRMKDWIKLSPDERKAARDKFKTLQKAPPEHKEALKQKWQEYKELPEEEKKKLQELAATKPRTTAGMKSAAPPPPPPSATVEPVVATSAPSAAPKQ